ncbi:GNAT family N-acetyltransferase [Rhodococcus sp. CC-R104]|uniref:GNAT family N-acetyltransferase n=1 Tax=Rhodococcus chondri TaxID=3065941 RepID=A0ABU7JL84_9NOCA|nr:GNAT family N-acetyltransferase [Rhodococcus sp. CC-R104]MEE2030796.1 GNAT family N-acetyltransferase [Rhodococcus sp. CC-R104]
MPSIRFATLDRIDPATLYRIVRLRIDVFVYEQGIICEPELDGRDLEPTTTLFWSEQDGDVLATLRVLFDGPALHIGRVTTAKHARGHGLAARLLEAVFEAVFEEFAQPIEISAQAYLEKWYERFGFRRTGPDYLEAGIDHVPMRRAGP